MSTGNENQNTRSASFPRVLFAILSAAAVGITLLVLPFSRSLKGSSAPQEVFSSPFPMPAAVSAVDITLPGTPVPAPEQTPMPYYPEGAMDLVVNGAVLFTLPSGEAAVSLTEAYASYFTSLPLADNEFLIHAALEAEVSVTAPSGNGTLLSKEEALAYLIQNPSLLPFSRTVRTIEVEETALNDQQTVSETLPAGVTVIRRLERPSYQLFYTDREYQGETLLSKTVADGFLVGTAATGRITESGAEPDPSAEPSPSPAPGSLAESSGFSLSVPVKGTVSSGYGKDEKGVMRYGVDYLTEAGYAVYSPGEGTVVYCGPRGGLGNVVEIKHDESGFISRLIGLDGDIMVELYQRVKKGDRLGQVAAAPGRVRPVFRYELMLAGIPVDPLPYIK